MPADFDIDKMAEDTQALISHTQASRPLAKHAKSEMLMLMSSVLVGTQFAFSVQTVFSTPLFKELGASHKQIAYLRLPGPLTGLVVQPAVGWMSDAIGTRSRPLFVLFGVVSVALGYVVFPQGQKHGSIDVAFAGLWLFDIGFNAADEAVRALAADTATREQQSLANSIISSALGCGQVLGYALGSLHLTRVLVAIFGTNYGLTDLQVVCGLGLAFLLFCCALFLIAILKFKNRQPNDSLQINHTPLRDQHLSESEMHEHAPERYHVPLEARFRLQDVNAKFLHVWQNTKASMKGWMSRLCMINGITWAAWYTYVLFISDWMGRDVFCGSPSADPNSAEFKKYTDGQHYTSIGLALNSLLMIPMGAITPTLVERFGLQNLLGCAALILSVCLGLCWGIVGEGDKVTALTIIVLTGIPWSWTMSLPYAIVSSLASPQERGTLLGLLNIFVVIPQMLVLLSVAILPLNARGILGFGSIIGILAFVLSLLTEIHPEIQKRKPRSP